MILLGRRGGAVDEAVLAELRAIREEIRRLSERVGDAASREELNDYCTVERFEEHIESHQRRGEGWRAWLPIALSAGTFVFYAGAFIVSHITFH